MNNIISEDEIKKIEIDIMKEIDRLCTENKLNYNLFYGSLLGAVRHKGFIPWDDDMDIIMERNDYEKLISIIRQRKNVPEWLSVLDSSVDEYYYPFAKVVDNRTVAKMETNLTEHGIWVDVFPIDNIPQSKIRSKNIINICYFLRELTISMTADFSNFDPKKKIRLRTRILHSLGSILGKKRVCKTFERIQRKYRNCSSELVADLLASYKYKEIFDKKIFTDQSLYDFESYRFKGPADYDYVLSQLYGDYLSLPPVEKRRSHKILAWYK